jgi:hypothetical protein
MAQTPKTLDDGTSAVRRGGVVTSENDNLSEALTASGAGDYHLEYTRAALRLFRRPRAFRSGRGCTGEQA